MNITAHNVRPLDILDEIIVERILCIASRSGQTRTLPKKAVHTVPRLVEDLTRRYWLGDFVPVAGSPGFRCSSVKANIISRMCLTSGGSTTP